METAEVPTYPPPTLPHHTPPTGTIYTVLPDTLISSRAVQGLLSSLIKLLLLITDYTCNVCFPPLL